MYDEHIMYQDGYHFDKYDERNKVQYGKERGVGVAPKTGTHYKNSNSYNNSGTAKHNPGKKRY